MASPQSFEWSIEDEIGQVMMFRPHVVILGAGASRAAFPEGDADGKVLPLMADLIDALGLRSQILEWKIDADLGFEDIFSQL
jgi:hypothetical protein